MYSGVYQGHREGKERLPAFGEQKQQKHEIVLESQIVTLGALKQLPRGPGPCTTLSVVLSPDGDPEQRHWKPAERTRHIAVQATASTTALLDRIAVSRHVS